MSIRRKLFVFIPLIVVLINSVSFFHLPKRQNGSGKLQSHDGTDFII